jgi:hypothetical protein
MDTIFIGYGESISENVLLHVTRHHLLQEGRWHLKALDIDPDLVVRDGCQESVVMTQTTNHLAGDASDTLIAARENHVSLAIKGLHRHHLSCEIT